MDDRSFEQGRWSAYRDLLTRIAGELGTDTSEGKLAALLSERLETVRVLRALCAEHGDNDWPDNLYLPDVLEKHIAWPDP